MDMRFSDAKKGMIFEYMLESGITVTAINIGDGRAVTLRDGEVVTIHARKKIHKPDTFSPGELAHDTQGGALLCERIPPGNRYRCDRIVRISREVLPESRVVEAPRNRHREEKDRREVDIILSRAEKDIKNALKMVEVARFMGGPGEEGNDK